MTVITATPWPRCPVYRQVIRRGGMFASGGLSDSAPAIPKALSASAVTTRDVNA
jgi:hypothetical protein